MVLYGKYLGWLEGQIMYDTEGAPYKSYKQYAKYRLRKKNRFSGVDAELYLTQGRK